MSISNKLYLIFVLSASVVAVSQAQVAVNLANDFSISNGNPNGLWTYSDNATLLSVEIPLNNGNPFYTAASNGYWGVGNDLYANTPDLFKAAADGTSAGETTNDFLAGDILGHSPNDGTFLKETWTAPSFGVISNLNFAAWYAHSSVNRSSEVTLVHNGTVLTQGVLTNGVGRSSALTYSGSSFNVAQGDIISIWLQKSSGQSFGSIAGESLSFTYTATPEPFSMVALGAGALALVRRRKAS